MELNEAQLALVNASVMKIVAKAKGVMPGPDVARGMSVIVAAYDHDNRLADALIATWRLGYIDGLSAKISSLEDIVEELRGVGDV